MFCIYQSVSDYLRYDVITSVERVAPANVTFPAVTICNSNSYYVDHYINGTKQHETKSYFPKSALIIQNFIRSIRSWSMFSPYPHLEDFSKYKGLDAFTVTDFEAHLDCFRINGARNNYSQFMTTNETSNTFYLTISAAAKVDVSSSEWYVYTMPTDPLFNQFYVFIDDNYLNAFSLKATPLKLGLLSNQVIRVEVLTKEKKLSTPLNQCTSDET